MANVTIQKLSSDDRMKRGIDTWPVWKKEVSRFDWEYSDNEECYILDGEIVVYNEDGNFHIGPGDFVIFKKGLKCTWDVSIPVVKHYNFF